MTSGGTLSWPRREDCSSSSESGRAAGFDRWRPFRDVKFFGFDSFEGLPEAWSTYQAGTFDLGGELPHSIDREANEFSGQRRSPAAGGLPARSPERSPHDQIGDQSEPTDPEPAEPQPCRTAVLPPPCSSSPPPCSSWASAPRATATTKPPRRPPPVARPAPPARHEHAHRARAARHRRRHQRS